MQALLAFFHNVIKRNFYGSKILCSPHHIFIFNLNVSMSFYKTQYCYNHSNEIIKYEFQ